MTITPTPWTPERRAAVTRKIAKEAERAARRLGAVGCRIVAFFPDGEYLHMLDAGKTPMSAKDLYTKLVSVLDVLEASGGEDVSLQ